MVRPEAEAGLDKLENTGSDAENLELDEYEEDELPEPFTGMLLGEPVYGDKGASD